MMAKLRPAVFGALVCSACSNSSTPAASTGAATGSSSGVQTAGATGASSGSGSGAAAGSSTGTSAGGGSGVATSGEGASGGSSGAGSAGSAQTPPTGGAAVEAWLAAGYYKQWASEPAIHASRSPSPHGFDRVYSNSIISANATGSGAWPQGAAAVKELYNAATDTTPVGYAVYLKTQADSAAGANWYFYERVPLSSSAPHDANGVVADGLGATGPAKTICVGCHLAAGSDAAHTPSLGGRDEVYTPVSAAQQDASTDAAAGTSQTPPTGRAAVEAWLAAGYYKQWHAEAAIHASRPPSPHGFDRVFSNAIINANATGTGPWPQGAAAVKELYNATTDTTPVGYAVYLKTLADSASGANWYFYERVPLSSSAPHDANGVVADGLGAAGAANTICVGCHVAAGSDAAHTPSPGGRDEVYTPVP